MIVASRALHTEPEERVGRHAGHIGEHFGPLKLHVALVVFVDPVAQKHGGSQSIAVARINLVPSQLLAHKPVVRFVGVERVDDVVAIAPRFGPEMIRAVAVRVRIAHEIEPKGCLPFAVARAGQQAVDQFAVGIRRGIFQERLHLFLSGWQTGEIQRHAPDQRALGGRTGRGQFLLGEFARNEMIDLIRRPNGAGFRHGRLAHGLVGPPSELVLSELRCGQRQKHHAKQNDGTPNHGLFIAPPLGSGEKIIGAKRPALRPAARPCRWCPDPIPRS